MYTYKGKIIKIIDGDTIDVEFDVGFHLKATHRCRLYGIDTPEKKEENWAKAKECLTKITNECGPDFIFKTYKSDSFGRWLIEIFTTEKDPISINEWMLLNGFAVKF